MSKRTYNIYFHVHTVSGIVITVGLFVIFFAGAFTLFFNEIEEWERTRDRYKALSNGPSSFNVDSLMLALEKKGYDLYGRDIYMDLRTGSALQPVYLSASEDSLATGDAKKSKSLLMNRETYEVTELPENSTHTLGALLYDLHFFYQLGEPGYYLSGVVSLFFLFAMVSGVIVHWKKIISNFYIFRPYEKLKTIWTDAHTALGTIGVPFQFMYALTGAWFGLGILVATSGALLYGGDESKYYAEIYGPHDERIGQKINLSGYRLNAYLDSATSRWPGFDITYISLHKAASATMEMNIYGEVDSRSGLFNYGELEFDVVSGKVVSFQDPYHKSYEEMVSASVHRLHFGYFGLHGWRHIAVKLLYFLLAMATCFVIITGVLIWLEARNKNSVPEKERKFNQSVGYIYLAVSLSMLPVTAMSFLVTRLLPESLDEYKGIVLNSVFFVGWLLTSLYLWSRRNNYVTNKVTLLAAGVLGLCVPLANGLRTGNWFWLTFSTAPHTLFIVDVLWLIMAALCIFVFYRIKRAEAAPSPTT